MTKNIPPLVASPEESAHFIQLKEQHLSDRARLLALFDAAAECRSDVSIWEREESDAPAALNLWASARHLPVITDADFETKSVEVQTHDRHHCITVYMRTP